MNGVEHELLVATRHGLSIVQSRAGRWHECRRVLTDRDVTGVLAREGVILAGTTEGVFRSDDAGHTWRPANKGLHSPHVRWMACHPDVSDLEFVGTEPAGIFV